MMGVYIKGIQMPKENQRGLWVVIHSDGTVEYDTGDYGWQTLRNAAIPVPPHGRLIDADALEYHADNVRDPMGRTEKTVMWKKIEAAPTIIPEEEAIGEDTNVPTTYDLLYEEGGAGTT